ncbi:hypothetical protein D3C85_726690 [compost metagenome]
MQGAEVDPLLVQLSHEFAEALHQCLAHRRGGDALQDLAQRVARQRGVMHGGAAVFEPVKVEDVRCRDAHAAQLHAIDGKPIGVGRETARGIPATAAEQLEKTAIGQAQDLGAQTILFDDPGIGSQLLQGAWCRRLDRRVQQAPGTLIDAQCGNQRQGDP